MSSEVFKEVKRKRKRMSSRMLEMLELIRKEGRVCSSRFKESEDSYRLLETINALSNRLLISDEWSGSERYWRISNFTDEAIESYIKVYEEVERKEQTDTELTPINPEGESL